MVAGWSSDPISQARPADVLGVGTVEVGASWPRTPERPLIVRLRASVWTLCPHNVRPSSVTPSPSPVKDDRRMGCIAPAILRRNGSRPLGRPGT